MIPSTGIVPRYVASPVITGTRAWKLASLGAAVLVAIGTGRIGDTKRLSLGIRGERGVGTTVGGSRGSSAETALGSLIRAGLGDIRVLLERSFWGQRKTRFVVGSTHQADRRASFFPR